MGNRGIAILLSVLILHSILTGCSGSEMDENDTGAPLEELPDIEETDSEGGDEPELSEDEEVEIDGCNYPTERGVVLSFDDRKNIQSWNESREFFDSRGVKATFFVDNWDTIEDWELEILRNLSSDGHEIGFHSTSHGDYYDFLEQNLTADDYFESEIIAGLELMESYGFFPTSFAYPRGHRDTEIDELILNEFSVLRGTRSNVNGSESWMAECKDLSVFRSFSLTDEDTKWIPHSFNESEESKISILLNGHGIGGGGYPISYDELEYLINEIERFDLSFLLMSELSK
jgi:peptidoglycan/xylan/chitin deacetylase (PgdA/CDA1 family)